MQRERPGSLGSGVALSKGCQTFPSLGLGFLICKRQVII